MYGFNLFIVIFCFVGKFTRLLKSKTSNIFRNFHLNKWAFLGLLAFGSAFILAYVQGFFIQVHTRNFTDLDYEYLFKGTKYEIAGRVPPFGMYIVRIIFMQISITLNNTILSHLMHMLFTYVLLSYV